jgi:hypothetical protein
LVVSRDLDYLDKKLFNSIANQTIKAAKLINGLKKIRDEKYTRY